MWNSREEKARTTSDEESLAHFLSMNPAFGYPQVSQRVVQEATRIRREDAQEREEDRKWQEHVCLCTGRRSEPIAAPDTDPCRKIINGVEHK